MLSMKAIGFGALCLLQIAECFLNVQIQAHKPFLHSVIFVSPCLLPLLDLPWSFLCNEGRKALNNCNMDQREVTGFVFQQGMSFIQRKAAFHPFARRGIPPPSNFWFERFFHTPSKSA